MVVCEQLIVGGEIKRYNPPTPCQSLEKPPTVELCNYGTKINFFRFIKVFLKNESDLSIGACPTTVAPTPKPPPIGNSNTDLGGRETSSSSSESSRQEYRFKVGGEAKVYEGSRLKIKCPVKNFDRARISWLKDGVPLKQSGTNRDVHKRWNSG